jgi:hypothetical protein
MTGSGHIRRPWSESQAACYKGKTTYIFGGYAEKDPAKGLTGSTYYGDGVRISCKASDSMHAVDLLPLDGLCPAIRGGATLTLGAHT